MAVDLADHVESLRREISPPGSDLFPDATDGILTDYLSDAFWNAKLDGILQGYTEADGIITPESGTTDIPRDLVSLVIFYASMAIIAAELRNKNTLFRTQAGPVEYETQNSAQLLRDHLRMLVHRREQLLDMLSTKYNITPSYVDSVLARTESVFYGDITFDSGVAGDF